MADYPVGTYRSATFGATISNFQSGQGAIRVFNVFIDAGLSTLSCLTFYNGSASSTANAYFHVAAVPGTVKTSNYWDSHAGILFPNGCFITTGAALLYGVVSYRTETI